MKKAVPLFIPHYGNSDLLINLIQLSEKYCNYPINYCIYDSTPEKISANVLKNIPTENRIFYRHVNYNINENTYPYVLRDFLLSDDYEEGAIILPHDELVIIDYQSFKSNSEDKPFTCGRQLSYCPDTKKIVEINLSPFDGEFIAWDYAKSLYSPQYHATYLPRKIAHPYGIFLSKFIDRWGAKNSLFSDFVLLNILNRLNIFYSTESVYFKEQRITRKTTGKFIHPAAFVSTLNKDGIIVLQQLLDNLWNEVGLPTTYRDKSISFLLKSSSLKKSLALAGINKHDNLFIYKPLLDDIINYQKIDIFNGYHLIGNKTTSDHIKFIFDGRTALSNKTNLSCLYDILNFYGENSIES